MKYKVTTRGWIVFSILGLVLLFSLFQIGGMLLSDDGSEATSDNLGVASVDNDSNENSDSINGNEDESVDNSNDDSESSEDSESTDELDNEDDSSNSDTNQSDEDVDEEADSVDVIQIDINKKSDILFDKNISVLNETYFIILDEWVELLKENESITITIEGHINGYPYYNDGQYGLSIANERAKIVKYYLTENGIDESRIQVENKGSTDQVNKDDQDKHYLNRRAVIKIN